MGAKLNELQSGRRWLLLIGFFTLSARKGAARCPILKRPANFMRKRLF
ncbi:hypothetical protein MHY1_00221 [Methylovirgula sp. HY1]|nr:hypothetical protein MHY1_00221 [Methylovirgula sp. HY1]